MIGGQQQDLEGGHDLAELHRLKTGALFSASIMCGVWAAGVPRAEHAPWRAFAAELGLLFQVVDDILDGDGYVVEVGERGGAGARRRRGRARRGAARRDPGRHVGALRDRRQARRAHLVTKKRLDVAARRARARREPGPGAGARDGRARAGPSEGRRAGRRGGAARGRAAAAVRLAGRAQAGARARCASASIPPASTASTSAPRPAASPTCCSSAARRAWSRSTSATGSFTRGSATTRA